MMGSAKYDGLSDEQKKAIAEAGHEVIAQHYAHARDQEAQITKQLEEKGVTISKIEDLAEMQAKTKPVLDAWVAKDPLIEAFVNAVEK